MNVEIKIDNQQDQPRVLIITREITEEINLLMKQISQVQPTIISGILEDKLEILKPQEIIRIYATQGKVFASYHKAEYLLKHRLYEIEEKLDSALFVRISNAEIINLKMVKNFDLNFTGTIRVHLMDGTTTYASRRYVLKIKKILGI